MLNDVFDTLVKHAKEDPLMTTGQERVDHVMMVMQRNLPEITERATAAVGMSAHEFQNCLMHFQATDNRYERDVILSQERQQRLRHELQTM